MTIISLTVFIVVSVTLFFTVLKPKQPQVTARPASLENIEVQTFPTFGLNATLGLVVTINNPNYGSFKYKNSTAYIDYCGTTVAEVPIERDVVPARGKLNVSFYANIIAEESMPNPCFWSDVRAGRFNLTSMATLHGKVILFKVFKFSAVVFSTCDVSIVIETRAVESKCNCKFKL